MRVHVVTEIPDRLYSDSVVKEATYGGLKPGSPRVAVVVKNPTSRPVTLPSKAVM